jgi:hypothetical protein
MAKLLRMGVFTAFFFLPRIGVGQTTTSPLTWHVGEGATGCPTAEAFRQRLQERMGVDPFAATNSPSYEILIEHERGRFGATFRQSNEPIAQRRFIGGDVTQCSELMDALVLAFSLLLRADPDVTTTDQPQEDRHASPLHPSPSVTSQSRTDPLDLERRTDENGHGAEARVRPEAKQRHRHAPGAWLAAGVPWAEGDLPKLATGAMLSAGIQLRGPWELTTGATYLGVERQHRYGANFAFSLTEGWLGGGFAFPIDERLRWRTQMAAVFGMLHGFPENHLPFDPGDSNYFAARLASHLGVEFLGPLGILAGVSSELRAKRWQFRLLDDTRVVWRQPHLGARAEILVSYELR